MLVRTLCAALAFATLLALATLAGCCSSGSRTPAPRAPAKALPLPPRPPRPSAASLAWTYRSGSDPSVTIPRSEVALLLGYALELESYADLLEALVKGESHD